MTSTNCYECKYSGNEYIAEDVGGAIKGNRIDIFVADHQEALNRGVITREVFIGD